MIQKRTVVLVSSLALVSAVALSAGGCSSRDDDESERLGKQSQALEAGDECREVRLEARRAAGAAFDDARELEPPLRFAVPAEISLSGGKNRGAHWVKLSFHRISGGDASCRYKGGANKPSDRALLDSCTNALGAGSVVTADSVTLAIENGNALVASVTLREEEPCGGDAGSDAATDSGGGAGGGGGDASDAAPDAVADAATDSGTCDPSTCTTSNPCLTSSCGPTGCSVTPAPDGLACSDQNACTGGDVCVLGLCTGTPVTTTSTECKIVTCDPVVGILVTNAPDGQICSDSSACTSGDQCTSGACAGAPIVLPPASSCQSVSCDPILGVVSTPLALGSSCDDGSACTANDQCTALGCQGSSVPTDDGNLCTVDSCSPATGPTHTLIPRCDPSPIQGDAPFEPRASVMGRLVTRTGGAVTGATFTVREAPAPDGSGSIRGDVSASTGGDGSFRLRLTTFPDVATDRTPPLHVLLRVDAAGVLPVFRDAWLHTGTATDLGIIKMVPRDAASTPIGPAGGTANDSANTVQVVIPAGALSTTINVVITPFAARDEFPAPLPDSTATMYGFELEPSGTTFSAPVTVRIANTKNIPTSFSIPTGFFDSSVGRWEHVAQSTWDGTRFAFPTTHFSPYDANGDQPRKAGAGAGSGGGGGGGGGPECPGSSVEMTGGALNQTFHLPM